MEARPLPAARSERPGEGALFPYAFPIKNMKRTAHYWLWGSLGGMTLLWLLLFRADMSAPPAPPPAPVASPPCPPPFAEDNFPPPSTATPRSGLLIVMDDMGEDRAAVRQLLRLNIPLTFSIWPHGRFARETAEAAHAAGREVFVHLPMQPRAYPRVRPGPYAITADSTKEEMRELVRDALRRVPYAAGLNNHMGSLATSHAATMEKFCAVLASTALVILDSITYDQSLLYVSAVRHRLPALQRWIFLDHAGDEKNILKMLRKAERRAAQTCTVVIGHPRRETLTALSQWAATRNASVPLLTARQMLWLDPAP